MLKGAIDLFIMVERWGWEDAILMLICLFMLIWVGEKIYALWKR